MFDGLNKPSICIHDVSEIIKARTREGQIVIERFLDTDVQDVLQSEENKYLSAKNNYSALKPLSVVKSLSNSDAVKLYVGAFTSHVRKSFFQDYLDSPCPICGNYYENRTLDHVLPKSRYTQYTVTPINLVPMCLNCNKAKGTSRISFHPYFQDLSQLEGISFEFDFSCRKVVSVQCSHDELAQYLRVYEMDKKLEVDANLLLRNMISVILNSPTKMPSQTKVREIVERQQDAIDIVPWKKIFYDNLLRVADCFYDELKIKFEHRLLNGSNGAFKP